VTGPRKDRGSGSGDGDDRDADGRSSGAPSELPSVPAAPPGTADSRRDPSRAAAYYSRWARVYDLIARRTPLVGRLRRRAVEAAGLERGDTVLEVGCGTGANLALLAREVGPRGTVLGLDLSRGAIGRARRSTRGYPQVEVLQADARDPPLAAAGSDSSVDPAEGVDAVLATFVVGMLEDPAAAVRRWCDLVAPGGHVVLLNLRRSESRLAPLANLGLDVATRLSTPPTLQVRYERDVTVTLDRRVRAAHGALAEAADATVTESHVLDLVELTGGRID